MNGKLLIFPLFFSVANFGVTITDGDMIQEGSSHSFTFNAVITLEGTNGADIPGIMNRWQLEVFIGSGGNQCVPPTMLSLTPAQAGVEIAAGGSGMIQEVVTGSLNLAGCLCSNVTHLEVSLSSPGAIYTLVGSLDFSAPISCNGKLKLLNCSNN